MATSLAAMTARRAANLARFTPSSSSASRASSLIPRRGLAGAADHHGPPKFVIVSLSGWGLLLFGGYKFFTRGKKDKEEKLVEAAH